MKRISVSDRYLNTRWISAPCSPHNTTNIVHKMEIFTSLMAISYLALHETDREARGRDAHGCVWQIVFARGRTWCLFNVCVPLFMSIVYWARVGVLVQRSPAEVPRGHTVLTERLWGLTELIGRGPRGPEQRRGQSRSAVLCVAGPRGIGQEEGGVGVQVCVDLLLQRAVSKETGVCCPTRPERGLFPPPPPPLEPAEESQNPRPQPNTQHQETDR